MAGQMLFACFWALLILRNLQTAYMVEKIASAIEKEINKKENKTFERNPFQRFFLWLLDKVTLNDCSVFS